MGGREGKLFISLLILLIKITNGWLIGNALTMVSHLKTAELKMYQYALPLTDILQEFAIKLTERL